MKNWYISFCRLFAVLLFAFTAGGLLTACGLEEEVEALVADVTPLNGYWIADVGSGRADDLYAHYDVSFLFDSSRKYYLSDDPMLGGGEFSFKVRKHDGDLFFLNMNDHPVTIWLMTGETALMFIEGTDRIIPLTKQARDGQLANTHGRR